MKDIEKVIPDGIVNKIMFNILYALLYGGTLSWI